MFANLALPLERRLRLQMPAAASIRCAFLNSQLAAKQVTFGVSPLFSRLFRARSRFAAIRSWTVNGDDLVAACLANSRSVGRLVHRVLIQPQAGHVVSCRSLKPEDGRCASNFLGTGLQSARC